MIRKHTRRAAKAAFAIACGVAIILGGNRRRRRRREAPARRRSSIGTKNFGEEFVLGQLYKQALEAKGFKVSYKENIGSTELIHKALTSGKINDVSRVHRHRADGHLQASRRFPKTAAATYALAKRALRGEGLHALRG